MTDSGRLADAERVVPAMSAASGSTKRASRRSRPGTWKDVSIMTDERATLGPTLHLEEYLFAVEHVEHQEPERNEGNREGQRCVHRLEPRGKERSIDPRLERNALSVVAHGEDRVDTPRHHARAHERDHRVHAVD